MRRTQVFVKVISWKCFFQVDQERQLETCLESSFDKESNELCPSLSRCFVGEKKGSTFVSDQGL
jgi:hypothetical protein